MSNESPRVEFVADNGIIEIRYFDTAKDNLCCSWKLPELIVNELIVWRISLKKNKGTIFPLQKRTKVCEFTMNTKKYIEIKSLDCRGRTNMIGWNLPATVVEKLVVWQKDAADK